MLYFFLSYASEDDSAGFAGVPAQRTNSLVGTFFNDLCLAVSGLAGTPVDSVGFLATGMLVGTHWPSEITRALTEARCIVSLTSTRYTLSEACGKEVGAFLSRIDRHEHEHGVRPPSVLPLIWIRTAELGEPLSSMQYNTRWMPPAYGDLGLKQLMSLRKFDDDYVQLVHDLAQRIVDTAHRYPLAPPEGPLSFDEIPSVFKPAAAPAVPHQRDPEAGTDAAAPPRMRELAAEDEMLPTEQRHVYFVVVAGTSGDMEQVRRNVEYYGPTFADWVPYQPELSMPLGYYACAIALTESFRGQVVDIDWLDKVVGWAEQYNQIIVLLLDVWSAELNQYKELLPQYDRDWPPTAPVLVPWNEADADAAGNHDKLWTTLWRVLPHSVSKNDVIFRQRVPSASQFRDELIQVLSIAGNRVLRNGPHSCPNEPSGDRPILGGP